MVQLHLAGALFLGLLAVSEGRPLSKRIAQTIADSTADWQTACLAAGGGEKCNPTSVNAFQTLLAAAGPCDQQNAADEMIDLAHTLGSPADMIRLTQLFAQQPRNSVDGLSGIYCQQAPRNAELNGLFQCQFAGANLKVFHGNVPVGQPGTIPFGLNAPVNPLGTCHASNVPVPDGQQLEKITQNPGVTTQVSTSSTPAAKAAPPAAVAASPIPAKTSSSQSAAASPAANVASNGKSFTLQNGLDAQALNKQFASLTTSSPCTNGQNVCIKGQFAQCANGQFVVEGCAAGTSCFALPLVNEAGTSVTCDTRADALARIAETGATGGLTG